MRRAAVILAALALAAPAFAAEAVTDGSFEAGTANPHWTATSSAFGSSICSTSSCGDGGGTAGPRTGSHWVWFGATDQAETAAVSQVVSLPKGSAVLSFWVWIGLRSGNGADAMRVLVDGQKIWELREDASGFGSYRQVTLGIHGYADGGPHTLRFAYAGKADPEPFPEVNVTNISLDDVSIDAVAAPTPKQAGVPTCGGKPATLVGTDGDDTMIGTPGADVMILGGGNDRAKTKGGSDRVCAGAGKDVVASGGGRDVVLGQGGNDLLKGGGGNDKLNGGGGKDALVGGGGTDVCKGGPGKDRARACEKGKA